MEIAHSTKSAATRLGFRNEITLARLCRKHPGFGIKLGNKWRVPDEHLERLELGESPEQIAAERLAKIEKMRGRHEERAA